MTLYERFFEQAPDAVVVVDEDGRIIAANETVRDVLGHDPETLVGRGVEELLPARYAAIHVGHRDRYRRRPSRRLMGVGEDLWARRADGTEITVDVSLSPLDTDEGPVTVAAIRDVSSRRRADAALRASEHRFRLIFQHAPVGVALVGVGGTLRRVNPALAALLAVPRLELEGTTVTDWVPPDHVRRIVAALDDAGPTTVEVELRGRDGTSRWVRITLSPVDADDGELVAVVEDVTDQRRHRLDLEHRATHDPLTGLVNRSVGEERIRVARARAKRTGQRFGVLFVDLDGFKTVNDRHGHATGDAVLVEMARRVTGAVRPEDTAARHGGDEFVVCCEDLGIDDEVAQQTLDEVADRLRYAVAAPVDVGGQTVALTASVGVALVKPGDETTPSDLVAAADEAMYRAKRRMPREPATGDASPAAQPTT